MSEEFSFELNDKTVNSLKGLIDNNSEHYVKTIYPNDEERIFKVDKFRYNLQTYKKKKGKRYKRFIKSTNEFIFEGVCSNE